ncbi:DUF2235 domain-containing protein [Duganella sp. HH105]|uniref:T6SS phospholipase effector Tle1-like catalytic domain-containing protein n=1 Tax=Duganella sp. HH105 TaxID=1781067 RepID=UPI0008937CAB|nr:DUF2235 domain-containing protein [Duganella sp. HH105]OEZ63154.1 hypothetical protein DUGA6_09500 [Duganella sp. HH105]
MTSMLSPPIALTGVDPSRSREFFLPEELVKIDKIHNARECPDTGSMPPPCNVNMVFGFFFDGTNNNLQRDFPTFNHSNVARLYLAFPGGDGAVPWPEDKTSPHYFRTYVPGVGTKFEPVADTGEGDMKKDGLAFAKRGQNRIIWALVAAINNVHKYYLGGELVSASTFLAEYNSLDLPSFGATKGGWFNFSRGEVDKLTAAFTKTLSELHKKLAVYLPIGEGQKKDKGVVEHLYYSIFGFSRGAAEARVFANWFLWLCRLDAKLTKKPGPTLGSIPVTFDFMGLFDTVASVGLASSAPVFGAHGHYGWADATDSLKVPEVPPTKCLHLVSAHEIRRSFPLDSIMSENTSPANCTEIVMPGVHSDVGGGYFPKEQGRGKEPQGEDMLSRVSLSMMYRAARLAGVPLKLEDAPETVKRGFRVSPKLIETFNAFVTASAGAAKDNKPQPLHEIMAKQHQLYIQWRKKMIGNMKALQSVIDSDSCDREDILAADKELAEEVEKFDYWRAWKRGMTTDSQTQTPFSYPEWATIETYWDQPAPPAAITDLFDNYVHDSRAWFKPFGTNSEDVLEGMEQLAMHEEKVLEWQRNPVGPKPAPLTKAEFDAVTKYKPYRKTAQACAAAGFVSKGREGVGLSGGFLRYRKIYMGDDRFKPEGAVYAQVTPATNNSPAARVDADVAAQHA